MIDLSAISISATIVLTIYSIMWLVLAVAYLIPKRKSNAGPHTEQTLVTALIPARNEEKVIRNIIQDLGKQTYRNLEILVVAHNCEDNTLQAAIEASETDTVPTRISKLETSESGKGLALQFGLEQANGEIIAYFDADNRVPPTTIESAVRLIEEGYDGAQTKILAQNPHQNRLTFTQHAEFTIYHTITCSGKQRLNLNSGIGGTGVILRRSALLAVGGFRNLLVEDYDLLTRLTLAGFRVGFAEDAVVYDEKPVSWRSLIRQRARWTAGHIQLWRLYSAREKLELLKSPIDFLLFHYPLSIICLAASSFLTVVKLTSPQVYFWSLPAGYWIALMVALNLFFSLVLHREGGFRLREELALPYLLTIYSSHWFAAFIQSFRIKGWSDTKTDHGNVVAGIRPSLTLARPVTDPVASNARENRA